MHRLAVLIALFANVPVSAQTHHSVRSAPSYITVVGDGWQVTPQLGTQCALAHIVDQDRIDIGLTMDQLTPIVTLKLPLYGDENYKGPVEFSFHRADPVLLGSRTFHPEQGALGVVMIATLPLEFIDTITRISRLNIYDPGDHLLRSVRLKGARQAIEALQHCVNASALAMQASPQRLAVPAQVTDTGWNLQGSKESCSIARRSANGADLVLSLDHQPALVMALHLHGNGDIANGTIVPVSLNLGNGAGYQKGDEVRLHVANGQNGLILFGGVDPRFLLELRQSRWSEMIVQSDEHSPLKLRETVQTEGAESATIALSRCVTGK